MDKPSNPSAFPSEQHECQDGSWNQTYEPGMSLRDWFAGQALIGGLAVGDGYNFATPEQAADMAYQIADAMLAERERQS